MDILHELRRFDALRDGDVGGDELLSETVGRISPVYADYGVFDSLTPKIAEHLHEKGVTHLYQHQADAI